MKGGGPDCEGVDDQEAIGELCKRLQNAQESAQKLIDVLEEARGLFENVAQENEGVKSAAMPFARWLLDNKVSKHKSQDVCLYAAACFGELLCMYAPDPDIESTLEPFSDNDYKEIIQLIIKALERLAKHNDPLFEVSHCLLQVMHKVKFYLLPIELECPSLISDMLKMFFYVVNKRTIAMLEPTIVEVIQSILYNADEIPGQWIQILLTPLLQDKSHEPTVRLSESVLSQAGDVLKAPIKNFLVSSLSSLLSTKTGLASWCHKMGQKLGSACPDALEALIPHFDEKLEDSNSSVRLETVEVLGKLLSEPGGSCLPDAGRIHLIKQFAAKRFMDIKADVRSRALTYFPDIVWQCGSLNLQVEIVESAKASLLALDEKIRSLAACGICTVAGKVPSAVDPHVLSAALLRLRDVKPSVRRSVAKEVTGMIRQLLTKNKAGAFTNSIALSLGSLLEVCGDPSCSQALHMGCSIHGLMPEEWNAEDCALAWVRIFQDLSDKQATLFFRVLKKKADLQGCLIALLNRFKESKEQNQAREDDLKLLTKRVSRLCPDPQKALEQLELLLKVKDKEVFSLLEQHLDSNTQLNEDPHTFLKPILARVGSKGSLADFLRIISAIARPTLINSTHLEGLMQLVTFMGDTSEQADCDCALILLKDVAKRSGILFSSLGQEIHHGLTSGSRDLQSSLLYVIANCAGDIRDWCTRNLEDGILSDLRTAITEMISDEAPDFAKHGILGINGILAPAEAQKEMEKMLSTAMTQIQEPDFAENPDAPAVFQALCSIGQAQPGLFSRHAEEIVNFLLHVYLPAPLPADNPCIIYGLNCSSDVFLKCGALMAFAKGCVSKGHSGVHKRTQAAATTFFEFIQEQRILDFEQDCSVFGIHSEDDAVAFRLSATFAVLHLCRNPVLEGELPNKLYTDVAMTVQDTDMLVRGQVALKLKKQLELCYMKGDSGAHCSARYAACLALAGIDPIAERRIFAKEVLQKYVKNQYQYGERSGDTTVDKKLACKQPEFLLPFLIYVVVHHEDVINTLTTKPKGEDEIEHTRLLADIQRVLLMGLEPMLMDPDKFPSSYHTLRATLTKLRLTEDAQERNLAPRIRAVCDMALAVLDGWMAASGKELPSSAPTIHPAIPMRFFRKSAGPRTAEGMNLPKLFELITIEPAIIMNKKGRRRKASSIQGKSKKRSLTTPRKQGKKRNFPDETSSAPSPVSSSDTAESFEDEHHAPSGMRRDSDVSQVKKEPFVHRYGRHLEEAGDDPMSEKQHSETLADSSNRANRHACGRTGKRLRQ